MKKTVCIAGSHPDTRDNIPWDDETIDIWVLNEAASKGWAKRYDAVFQLHVEEIYSNPTNVSDNNHWGWLQEERGIPVYMQDVDLRVPDSVKYPLDEILDELPGVIFPDTQREDAHELTSSFPYAFALAIYKGYDTIKIIGVEMASSTEYEYQLGGLKFWSGYAKGRGVNVEYYSGHGIWPALLYAYDGREITIPTEHFERRVETLQPVFDKFEKQHMFLKKKIKTAIQDYKPSKAGELFMKRRDLAVQQGEIAGRLGVAKDYVENLANIAKVTEFAPFDRHVVEIRAAKSGEAGEESRDLMNHTMGKCEYVFNIWEIHENPDARKLAAKQFLKFMEDTIGHCYKLGAMKGNMMENQEIMMVLDEKMRAAGGAKSIPVLAGSNGHAV